MKPKLLIVAMLLPLCGCMNMLVPKTVISGEISGAPFMLSSPKDATLNGLKVTSWNMGAFSNHVSIEIQSVTSKMNPEVITTTADGQVKLIEAVGTQVRQGLKDAAVGAATGGFGVP